MWHDRVLGNDKLPRAIISRPPYFKYSLVELKGIGYLDGCLHMASVVSRQTPYT